MCIISNNDIIVNEVIKIKTAILYLAHFRK